MEKFDELQKKLVPMWKMIGSELDSADEDANTVVVVPSLSVDIELTSSAQQAYEERLLFMLFLLRQPRIRLIYVTSQIIQPEIIDYYLDILPGVIISNARKRLFLVSPQDGSSRPLSQKVLDRPNLIRRIRSLIPDHDRAHMVPFNTTDLERKLAVRLGIPMYAADPRFFASGTKSGARHIFTEEGVKHPLGFEDLYSVQEIASSIVKMRAQRPIDQVVVKLNEGVSGLGNALLNLENLPLPGAADEVEAIGKRMTRMQFEAEETTYAEYAEKLEYTGAIVEEYISGVESYSPSVQLRVTPLGEVEMLSTHDQMLGGHSGQSYMGAIFPANPAYSELIIRDAMKVGRRFAQEGVIGRFAVDFVVVKREDDSWESYAIEVNLRKGGTTAPFLILQFLTDGHCDPKTGVFTSANKHRKYYVASDHLESPGYHCFTASHLFDIVSNHHLHFNHATQTGVIMHIITGVAELGRVGITAIADSLDDAHALYQRFITVLNQEAARLKQKVKYDE
jgi:hypothetical protein